MTIKKRKKPHPAVRKIAVRDPKLADVVYQARKLAGATQAEFGATVGVTESVLRALEKGLRNTPTHDRHWRIIAAKVPEVSKYLEGVTLCPPTKKDLEGKLKPGFVKLRAEKGITINGGLTQAMDHAFDHAFSDGYKLGREHAAKTTPVRVQDQPEWVDARGGARRAYERCRGVHR
ncbi:MAG: helix-turn-helix domain-containing protein, partial [Polyangiaceae bacterium]